MKTLSVIAVLLLLVIGCGPSNDPHAGHAHNERGEHIYEVESPDVQQADSMQESFTIEPDSLK